MPKPIPPKEVARRCLRRIQRWQSVPNFAEQERDYTFFTSAFPEYEMRPDEIARGISILEALGAISLFYPHPELPDVFVIRYIGDPSSKEDHA